jgi:hypothetical protein
MPQFVVVPVLQEAVLTLGLRRSLIMTRLRCFGALMTQSNFRALSSTHGLWVSNGGAARIFDCGIGSSCRGGFSFAGRWRQVSTLKCLHGVRERPVAAGGRNKRDRAISSAQKTKSADDWVTCLIESYLDVKILIDCFHVIVESEA